MHPLFELLEQGIDPAKHWDGMPSELPRKDSLVLTLSVTGDNIKEQVKSFIVKKKNGDLIWDYAQPLSELSK